jgi:hypothetical protein
VALLAAIFIMLMAQFYPGFMYQRSAIQDLLNVVMGREGDVVRIATRPEAILWRTLLAGGLVAVGLVGAWLLTGRFREFTLGRRQLVVSGFLLVTLVVTVPRLLPDDYEKVLPVGSLRVGNRVRDLWLSGDYAYLLYDDSLAVIDVSVPENPRWLQTVSVDPAWSLSGLASIGSLSVRGRLAGKDPGRQRRCCLLRCHRA